MMSKKANDYFPQEITVENFLECEFQEKFKYYAQQYGMAGRELSKGKKLEDKDFDIPDPDLKVEVTELVEELEQSSSGAAAKKSTVRRQVKKLYKEVYPEEYKIRLTNGLKRKETYQKDKQRLCSDLLLMLGKSLRNSVTQHKSFATAFEEYDSIRLFEIVVECATGQGAHSVYVLMMRFIALKQKSKSTADFSEYVKKYNETVTDLIRLGTPEQILKWLFNAKFVEGLIAEQFPDRLSKIFGEDEWPNYIDLQAELLRFINATRGISESFKKESNDGNVIIADAMKGREFMGTCFNCGKKLVNHRAKDCPQKAHYCTVCCGQGHLEIYCRENPENQLPGKPRDSSTEVRNEESGKAHTKERTFGYSKYKKGNGKSSFGGKRPPGKVRARRTEVNDEYDEENDEDANYEYEDDEEDEDYVAATCTRIIDVETETEKMVCDSVNTKTPLEDELFVLDSACVGSGHVVRRDDFFTSVDEGRTMHVESYDGKSTVIDKVGKVDGVGTSVHAKDAPNNLINLILLCKQIGGRYEGNKDNCVIYDRHGAVYARFKDYGNGFLSVPYKELLKNSKNGSSIRVSEVVVNSKQPHPLSPEEYVRAKEVYEFCGFLGHTGMKNLRKALVHGSYHNDTNLTATDLDNALKLFGPCPGCTQGKMVAPKALSSTEEPARAIGDRVYCDIVPFPENCKGVMGDLVGKLFGVDEKTGYVVVVGIKTKKQVVDATLTLLSIYNMHGHQVKHLVFDDEKIVNSIRDAVAKYKIRVTTTPAGMHNKRSERYTRTLKERMSAIQADMPYVFPAKLYFEHVLAAVRSMNRTLNVHCGSRTPFELFTGRKPRIPKYRFGQPGIFYSPRSDTPGQRNTEFGIYLGNKDDQPGHYRTFYPGRVGVYSTRRFQPTSAYPSEWGYPNVIRGPADARRKRNPNMLPPLPRPEPPRSELKAVPMAQMSPQIVDIQTGDPLPPASETHLDALTSYDASSVPPSSLLTTVPHSTLERSVSQPVPTMKKPISLESSAQDQEGTLSRTSHVPQSKPQASAVSTVSDPEPQISNTNMVPLAASSSPSKSISRTRGQRVSAEPTAEVSLPQKTEIRAEQSLKVTAEGTDAEASGRPRRQAASVSWKDGPAKFRRTLLKSSDSIKSNCSTEDVDSMVKAWISINRISLHEALKDEDKIDMTLDAAKTEIVNLYDTMKALKAVRYEDIPAQHRKNILNGHIFFKDQYNADGSFKRRKARFVMNGNEQDPTTIDDTRAPTVNPISLMCTLALSAQSEERQNDAYDIVGAFVCTEMPADKIIIARVSPAVTKLMIRFFPELKDFLDKKGCLYFYLKKFIYGLAEAAREFNLKLDKALKDLGFEPAECDPCLYTKDTPYGKHVLCTHVDDIYSSAPNNNLRKEFEKGLKKYFDLKSQHGTVSYLGMVIKKAENGDIFVNQSGYVDDMLKKFNVTEKPVGAPAHPNLTDEKENDELYHDRREFVSIIMSLMYVSRLTRVDMLMPVVYLSSKLKAPTVTHYKHARWILRYLKGTRSHGLKFTRCDDLDLIFDADASFLLHFDGYGHSGFLARLAGTVIFGRSVKQRQQTRSSTESELVSGEECSTYVVYTRKVCDTVGIKIKKPTVITQDNKSAIIMATQNGNIFKRSKHLVGRFNFLREQVKNGICSLRYVPTAHMVADILTKPVSREVIRRHLKQLGIVSQR
jgi:hypothetical protein